MARRPSRVVIAYIVAQEAEDDLRQIWRYLLGEAGLEIANRIQSELVDAFQSLADFPGKGHRRSDLTRRDVLFFSVYQYMIVYRRTSKLEIVAVLHGKRDLRRLLRARL
ncbi:MAG: type II toxin-antitoxin system RelE/ParE family toxin [Candidatus Sulfotelmatobacter sp.]